MKASARKAAAQHKQAAANQIRNLSAAEFFSNLPGVAEVFNRPATDTTGAADELDDTDRTESLETVSTAFKRISILSEAINDLTSNYKEGTAAICTALLCSEINTCCSDGLLAVGECHDL